MYFWLRDLGYEGGVCVYVCARVCVCVNLAGSRKILMTGHVLS